MLSLAKSPLAPVLGQHVPLRGPARLLFSSHARTQYQPQKSVTRVTTTSGDIFEAIIRLARLAGRDGEVIAIDPDPEVMRRTSRNVELNGLDNVRLISAAAGDEAGHLELYRPSPQDVLEPLPSLPAIGGDLLAVAGAAAARVRALVS